jgi:hypothetical protein
MQKWKEIAILKLLFPSTLLILEKWGKNGMEWKEIATPLISLKMFCKQYFYAPFQKKKFDGKRTKKANTEKQVHSNVPATQK